MASGNSFSKFPRQTISISTLSLLPKWNLKKLKAQWVASCKIPINLTNPHFTNILKLPSRQTWVASKLSNFKIFQSFHHELSSSNKLFWVNKLKLSKLFPIANFWRRTEKLPHRSWKLSRHKTFQTFLTTNFVDELKATSPKLKIFEKLPNFSTPACSSQNFRRIIKNFQTFKLFRRWNSNSWKLFHTHKLLRFRSEKFGEKSSFKFINFSTTNFVVDLNDFESFPSQNFIANFLGKSENTLDFFRLPQGQLAHRKTFVGESKTYSPNLKILLSFSKSTHKIVKLYFPYELAYHKTFVGEPETIFKLSRLKLSSVNLEIFFSQKVFDELKKLSNFSSEKLKLAKLLCRKNFVGEFKNQLTNCETLKMISNFPKSSSRICTNLLVKLTCRSQTFSQLTFTKSPAQNFHNFSRE